jgi:hypothetical protein
MCAHSGDTTVRINIQDTPVIVPWMPMMAGTLALSGAPRVPPSA